MWPSSPRWAAADPRLFPVPFRLTTRKPDSPMAKQHHDKNRGGKPGQPGKGSVSKHGSKGTGGHDHVHGPGCGHDHDHDQSQDHDAEVPEGVALLPEVPDSLGLHPFSLAILDTVVFLTGTDEELIHQGAADEMFGRLVEHLTKLPAADKNRFHADLKKLGEHGLAEGWDADAIGFLNEMATLLTGKTGQ